MRETRKLSFCPGPYAVLIEAMQIRILHRGRGEGGTDEGAAHGCGSRARVCNGFVTPLQRPEGQGPTLTREEVAQAEQRVSNFLADSFEPLDPDRAAPEATTNPGAYDLYTEPWGGEIPMWRQNEQIYEYACHEANYGMFNILRGARYQERQGFRSTGLE